MNHEDMSCAKAKDLIENYIHTEFLDRKDSDLGQAMIKAIILLEKESKLEEKYSDKNICNYYNSPKRFLHCPVCDYNRKHDAYGHNEHGHGININECPQCGFSVIILRTERNRSSNISDAMRRTCWNKVYTLYKNGSENGNFIVPWQTYYANSMKTENLHVKYGFDAHKMIDEWDISDDGGNENGEN